MDSIKRTQSYDTEGSSSSDSEKSDSSEEGFNRSRIEELILHKVTNELDPSYLPGILSVLKHAEEDNEEVEIDLGLLDREDLENLLKYVNTCLYEKQCSKKSNTKKKQKKKKDVKNTKKKSIHRRRLLENMINPSDGSSSSEESDIIIFSNKPVQTIKNKTILHESHAIPQGSTSQLPHEDLDEDETIDIML